MRWVEEHVSHCITCRSSLRGDGGRSRQGALHTALCAWAAKLYGGIRTDQPTTHMAASGRLRPCNCLKLLPKCCGMRYCRSRRFCRQAAVVNQRAWSEWSLDLWGASAANCLSVGAVQQEFRRAGAARRLWGRMLTTEAASHLPHSECEEEDQSQLPAAERGHARECIPVRECAQPCMNMYGACAVQQHMRLAALAHDSGSGATCEGIHLAQQGNPKPGNW